MIKLVLDLGQTESKLPRNQKLPFGKPNELTHTAIQIVRLPKPGVRHAGKRVGEKIQAQVVFEYVGPVTMTFLREVSIGQAGKKGWNAKRTPAKRRKRTTQSAQGQIVKRGLKRPSSKTLQPKSKRG